MMIKKFWNRFFALGRLFRCHIELAALHLRFGRAAIAKDLNIATGTRISVTDHGRILISTKCSIDRNATLIVKYGELTIGEGSYIGIGSVLCAQESIRLGRNVLIAEYVTIRDQDHEFESFTAKGDRGFTTKKVSIGDNVWLGAKVTITKGVTIGNNSVIGANSVVTCDIPPNVLAVGVPARVVRELN